MHVPVTLFDSVLRYRDRFEIPNART